MKLKSLATVIAFVMASGAAGAASPATRPATDRTAGDTTLAAVSPRTAAGGDSLTNETGAVRSSPASADEAGGTPEPKVYALLFAGLMAALFIARRRID